MTKFSLCLLSILVFINSIFGQTGKQYYEKAEKYMQAENPKKALAAIEKAIEKDGEKIEYLEYKSEIGKYISPEVCFEPIQRMLQLYPDSIQTYTNRASFYFLIMRDYDKCIDDLNQVLKMTDNDSIRFNMLNLRGTCYSYMGKHELALIDVEKTIALKPDDYDILNNKANSLFHLGRNDEAIELLKYILEKNPNSAYPYVNLGYQLQKVHQYEASAEYLKKGLEIDSKVAFTWNNLGYSQFKLGQYKEAIKSIDKSIKLDPSNSYAYRNLALIAIEQKEMEKACKHINQALLLKFSEMYGSEMEELRKKYCLN